MPLPRDIAIVIPVYNDWASLERLIADLATESANLNLAPAIFLMNDASTEDVPQGFLQGRNLSAFSRFEILDLAYNMGHQRAIAAGLSVVAGEPQRDTVIVMDSDGEDRAADVPRLLKMAAEHPGNIVVAERARRSEGITFRIFYHLYKFLFRQLTGKSIDFGNFTALPGPLLARLVLMPELWNNYGAAIIKSRFPVSRVPTTRGQRYAGRSSMNMISLITHGLGAISVFRESVFVRLISMASIIGLLVLAGIAIVLGIRLFTDLAIPGWASYMVGFLVLILLQAGLMLTIAVFLSLGNRSGDAFLPEVPLSRLIVRKRMIV